MQDYQVQGFWGHGEDDQEKEMRQQEKKKSTWGLRAKPEMNLKNKNKQRRVKLDICVIFSSHGNTFKNYSYHYQKKKKTQQNNSPNQQGG